jgi:hypothetical protein
MGKMFEWYCVCVISFLYFVRANLIFYAMIVTSGTWVRDTRARNGAWSASIV